MDKNPTSLIFCLAPAKVGMALERYEIERGENRDVYIICPLSSLYKFFSKLDLEAKIILSADFETEYRNINFISIKRHVKKVLSQIEVENIPDVRVFFTDWVTGIYMGLYLKAFNNYPQTLLHDESSRKYLETQGNKYIVREHVGLKMKIKEFIFSIIYGYRYKGSWSEGFETLCLDMDYYQYKVIDSNDKDIHKKYQFPLGIKGDKLAIVLTEPYRFEYQTEQNYNAINLKIVDYLHSKGYKVAMKGHPRLGNHPLLINKCDEIIDPSIPTEFLDLKGVKFVISFVSTSMCQAASRVKAYSVLPMCEITDQSMYDYFYKFVETSGKGKVKMISSFEEIEL